MWNSSGVQMLNPNTSTIPTKAHSISRLGIASAIATDTPQPNKLTNARAVDGSHSSKNIKLDQFSKFICNGLIASANSLP